MSDNQPTESQQAYASLCAELQRQIDDLKKKPSPLQALNLVVHKCSADPTNVLLNERAEIWREELEKNGIPVVWNAEQEQFV